MTDVFENVENKIKRETFDFAAAVVDREYAESVVPVYLNERKAQRLVEVTLELQNLDAKTQGITGEATRESVERISALQDEHDKLVAELKAEEYQVLIKGISPEESIALEDRAYEKFPIEYDESTHPLSGQTVRTEKPNPKRDEYYATLVRQAHLVKVTAPDGAIDDNYKGEENEEKVRLLWARLPIVAQVKLDAAIKESKVAVDYYRELVDEVF